MTASAASEQKVYLRKVRLNSGGYESDGTYWGRDIPLYCADCDDWNHSIYVRAYNREDAKDRVLNDVWGRWGITECRWASGGLTSVQAQPSNSV